MYFVVFKFFEILVENHILCEKVISMKIIILLLNICPPSIKFTQSQTVLRNSLKESPNDSLKDLWKSSSCHTNIQYDVYKSTKEVLNIWSEVQSHLPKNIKFTILPSATSTTPSLHVRIWQDGDYHKVLIAPFVLTLNHSFMLSLVVNSTLIALPGDTTQSLTSLPSHFNL